MKLPIMFPVHNAYGIDQVYKKMEKYTQKRALVTTWWVSSYNLIHVQF